MQRSWCPLSSRTRRRKKAQAGKGEAGNRPPGGWLPGRQVKGLGTALQRLGRPGEAKQQGRELLEKECPASRVWRCQDLAPELMTWSIFKTQEKSRLRKTFPGCERNPAATSVTPRITRVDLADVAG